MRSKLTAPKVVLIISGALTFLLPIVAMWLQDGTLYKINAAAWILSSTTLVTSALWLMRVLKAKWRLAICLILELILVAFVLVPAGIIGPLELTLYFISYLIFALLIAYSRKKTIDLLRSIISKRGQ